MPQYSGSIGEIVLKARSTGDFSREKEVKKAEHTCIGWLLKTPPPRAHDVPTVIKKAVRPV